VIFTNISRPGVNRIEIIKWVKELSPQTEIIAMTAFGGWNIYSETLKQRMQEFLSKPFNIPEIQNLINRIANSKKLHEL
jgi:DNA-binding NtrC family response regulator